MARRHAFSALLVTVAAVAPAAHAADWYVGGSIGGTYIDVSSSEIEQAFRVDDDFVATGTSLDDTDVGWKAYVGYRLFPVLSVEGAYVDLGEATFRTTIVEAPPPFDSITPFDIRARAAADGPQLTVLAHLPLTDRLEVLGRVGMFRWKADFRERIAETGATRVDLSEDDIDLVYGLGVQLALNDSFGTRIEWERMEGVGEGVGGRSGRDVDFFSVGLTLGF